MKTKNKLKTLGKLVMIPIIAGVLSGCDNKENENPYDSMIENSKSYLSEKRIEEVEKSVKEMKEILQTIDSDKIKPLKPIYTSDAMQKAGFQYFSDSTHIYLIRNDNSILNFKHDPLNQD